MILMVFDTLPSECLRDVSLLYALVLFKLTAESMSISMLGFLVIPHCDTSFNIVWLTV